MKKPSVKFIMYVAGCVIGFGIAGGTSYNVAKALNPPTQIESKQTTTDVQKPDIPTSTTITDTSSKPITSTTSTQSVAPKTTTTSTINTSTTSTQTPTAIQPQLDVFNFTHIDKTKVVVNSSKYNVTLDSTNVKVGDNIKIKITGIEKYKAYIIRAEQYANNIHSGSNGQWINGVYVDTIVVQNWATTNNQIKSYVFVKPTGEDMTYEYDFTLTVAP